MKMKSFASVDRVEFGFVVCEVELIPMEESKPEKFDCKETKMMDVSIDLIKNSIHDGIEEGDVIITLHDDNEVLEVYGKDEEERAARIAVFKQMMGIA